MQSAFETHSADTTSDRHLNVSDLLCAPSRLFGNRCTADPAEMAQADMDRSFVVKIKGTCRDAVPDPAIPAGAVAATASGPTAGQDLSAAPTQADCAGTDVQSAELENLTQQKKKTKKRRDAESGAPNTRKEKNTSSRIKAVDCQPEAQHNILPADFQQTTAPTAAGEQASSCRAKQPRTFLSAEACQPLADLGSEQEAARATAMDGIPNTVKPDDEEIPTPGTATQASAAKPAKKRRKSRSTSVESDTSCRRAEYVEQKRRRTDNKKALLHVTLKDPGNVEANLTAPGAAGQLQGSIPDESSMAPARSTAEPAAEPAAELVPEPAEAAAESAAGLAPELAAESAPESAAVPHSSSASLSKNDLSRAGNAPSKSDAHTFHDKQDQPVWGEALSADGLGLWAGHNPAAWGSSAVGAKQACPSKQAPQPCPASALPAVTPQSFAEVDMEVVDLAQFDESDDDVSEATALAQAEFSAICTALYSFEGGTCRVHLACKVQEQVAQCLMPGAPQIILVTGKETAGTSCTVAAAVKACEGPRLRTAFVAGNKSSRVSWPGRVLLALGHPKVVSHAVDLTKLQHVMTGQSQRSDSAPHVLVFIDKMKVANSMASHKKLMELFQVTMVPNSRLLLLCAGHGTTFSRLNTHGTVSIDFPPYSSAEINEEITQRTREWAHAITPDAVAYLASSEGTHKGSLNYAVSLCITALHKAAETGKRHSGYDCGSWSNLVSRALMEQTVRRYTPG